MLLAAAMMAVSMNAGKFGILVNSKIYYDGTAMSEKDHQGRDQFKASVSLQQGDKWCIYDAENKAPFTITIEAGNGSAKGNFSEGADAATCNVAGCYDFYIKLKWEDNSLWVQSGDNCNATGVEIGGGDDPVDPPTPPTPGGDDDVDFYAIGWINGADHGETAYNVFEDDFLFVDGKLTIDCKMGSYIAIKDHNGNFYYSRTETTIANTSVTMDWANGWSGGQKWAIPEGVNYIIIRSAQAKGQVSLERVDKATYDAYHWGGNQAIENTKVMPNTQKAIIDGQLRIVHGDKVFDATGRQL